MGECPVIVDDPILAGPDTGEYRPNTSPNPNPLMTGTARSAGRRKTDQENFKKIECLRAPAAPAAGSFDSSTQGVLPDARGSRVDLPSPKCGGGFVVESHGQPVSWVLPVLRGSACPLSWLPGRRPSCRLRGCPPVASPVEDEYRYYQIGPVASAGREPRDPHGHSWVPIARLQIALDLRPPSAPSTESNS